MVQLDNSQSIDSSRTASVYSVVVLANRKCRRGNADINVSSGRMIAECGTLGTEAMVAAA
jgi:hypothetical protein